MCLQALQRPLDRTPSFQFEEVAQQALLCQKLKAHSSAITASLILTDTGADFQPDLHQHAFIHPLQALRNPSTYTVAAVHWPQCCVVSLSYLLPTRVGQG